jgi:hypothetical protein
VATVFALELEFKTRLGLATVRGGPEKGPERQDRFGNTDWENDNINSEGGHGQRRSSPPVAVLRSEHHV